MKTILLSLVLGFVALHSSFGQTLKNLTYNASNGQVIYSGTNPLTFTNPLQFATNTRATTRTNLSLGWAALTNTNSSNFRTDIGIGATNEVTFGRVQVGSAVLSTSSLGGVDFEVTAGKALTFVSGGTPATTRTNLGLGATWLTNTNSSNFRTAIGLGSAATNDGSAFQPASSSLTNLASNNGSGLTNIPISGVVNLQTNLNSKLATNGSANGLTNFPTLNQNTTGTASNVTGVVAITNGGTGTNTAGGARTNLGLGATWLTNTNAVNFRSAIGLGSWAELNDGAQVRVESLNISDGEQANYTQFTTAGVTFEGGNDLQFREALSLGANNAVTFSNITARGTLTVTGNVTMSGVNNLAAQQTASSGASLMTRSLGDARFSPMPMTPQIIPWFYNGSLSVTRVTNGSATFGTSVAYPTINLTTNAADSGAMILVDQVWGAVDSAANPWNAVNKSVIIQGRLASTASNAVSRFVWSSSTNWPNLMTNLGTNGISNIGWAVETRNTGGSNEARLIVNGATNKSVSAWTVIGFNPGNDSSFMVVPRTGFTSLYWAASGELFSRTPLITITNQIGGSTAGAFFGGLAFSVINTNTPSGTSTTYIRRCYQFLGITNYGY